MEKLTEQKWFIWITKYWFLFPVTGFLLLAAAVFFGYLAALVAKPRDKS